MPEHPSMPTDGEPDDSTLARPPRRLELASETTTPSAAGVNLKKLLLSIAAGFGAAVVYWASQPASRDAGLGDLGYGIALLFKSAVAFVATMFATRALIGVMTREPAENVVFWLLGGAGVVAGLYSIL